MDVLPIDPHLPIIVALLKKAGALILSAPPGTGKTTRVPRALLNAGFADEGEILILEPRRLAARLAAVRVAQELGTKVGDLVGYSIRFENVAGPATRIRFLTEAILTRRIVQDPLLRGVSSVIIDEFHERHLATDLALAFLKQLQAANSRLKLVIMSATMDTQQIASFLPGAETLSISGSLFDLEIEYEDKPVNRPLHEKVAASVTRLIRAGLPGDVLVFLPGAAEIRRSADALASLEKELLVVPLHGDLSASEQSRAIEPAARKKIILATNVAETSVTLPGIAAVIDSGLARAAGFSPWSGLPTLSNIKISKSAAVQRAGRAGRTQSGRVLRLYTQLDFKTRPEYETPEIKRADLAETVLTLHGAGVRDLSSFSWFDAPSQPAVEAAENLLQKLGAVDQAGHISSLGRQMLRFPVHPRLARLIIEGANSGVGEESTLLAALLSERDIRFDERTHIGHSRRNIRGQASGKSDLLELLECFQEAETARFGPEQILTLGLDIRAVQAVRRAQRQLRHFLPPETKSAKRELSSSEAEQALLIAVLAAYPDRVAMRRKKGSRELLFAGGGSAILAHSSIVHDPMFVVAVDVEERKTPVRLPETHVRLASGIEIEWIAGLFPDAISQTTELIWNEKAGRVDEVRRTTYGQVPLEGITRPAPPTEKATDLLALSVIAAAVFPFRDNSALPVFQARMALVAQQFPHEGFPEMGTKRIEQTINELCRKKNSLAELAEISIVAALMAALTDRQRALLEREAPERLKLSRGRSVKVHYESNKSPWIESRLQDFFGMTSTPAICAGRVFLTLHLLAPNGSAVQVTQDLAGFWERHYPGIKRELQRRYPKHSWPELS
jgi:ATP-dependent helicase HrpB